MDIFNSQRRYKESPATGQAMITEILCIAIGPIGWAYLFIRWIVRQEISRYHNSHHCSEEG